MANFVRFMTFLFVFVLLGSANLRANVSNSSTFPSEANVLCEAPPPDSFRITTYGGTFFTLAWEPAWVGALHLIELKRQDINGNWMAERVFDNVPGDNFLIDSLIPGRYYRVYISTKCSNGDVSIFSVFGDGGLIVDLTLNGRVPRNPKDIKCTDVHYDDYEWVGFRVSGQGASGLFEFRANENNGSPYGYIERIATQSAIVAVNQENNQFPIPQSPLVHDVFVPFLMKHGGVEIGYIKITPISSSPKIFHLCPVPFYNLKFWNSNYNFAMLTADEIEKSISGQESTVGSAEVETVEKISVVNPVSELLTVFFVQLNVYGRAK